MVRPRVLLADDHAAVVAAIRRLLTLHGYDVVGGVGNGARVLEEAARLQPDVIVLDVSMPVMNGLDACRKLTRMMPQVRVIVLSVMNDSAVRGVALAAGAFAFINKQAAGTDLLPALRAACRDQRPPIPASISV